MKAPALSYDWKQLFCQLFSNCQHLDAQLRLILNENSQLEEELARKLEEKRLLLEIASQPHEESLREQQQEPQELPENVENKPKKTKKFRKQGIRKKNKKVRIESYSCPYENCERKYKSSIALNLHIKVNHQGGSKKQRQGYAKQLIDAEKGLGPLPDKELNLPPRFMQEFRRNYEYCKKYKM